MTELKINFLKSAQANAEDYFSRSKKARQKLSGLEKAMPLLEKRLLQAESKREGMAKKLVLKKKRQRNWFEKFHWSFTSHNFLLIGGRDAKSNELIVKKHLDEKDVYFHSDIHGAPHVVLKSEGRKPSENDLLEAASFAAIYSSAWKQGLQSLDVYSTSSEQVSKKAPSGESLGAGAFMVYGKREWFRKVSLDFGIGVKDELLFAGPIDAVKDNCGIFIRLVPGNEKKGFVAKKIRGLLLKKSGIEFDLDEINALLPTGDMDLKE